MMSVIDSCNEWDNLKSVVVGSADRANWPKFDPVFSLESKETPVPSGPVPQYIIDQANEDLDILANTLTQLGVEVVRPTPLDFQSHDGLYNYCPRDRLIVHGSTIIDTPMMYPCRNMEIQCYQHVLDRAAHVIPMPRTGLTLDAANVLRLNDQWLFLESPSGNRAAYQWLCDQFPELQIELCNFYGGVHIDSTIVAVREGLVLLNASRVNPNNCPRVFEKWEKIYIDDVVAQGFYQYPYASKWIALNMLSIDPQTVIVDKNQLNLIRLLEQRHFTVIPLELRHSRTLGGGFHCVTLDLCRQR
jgi:N-dimethylarginine dimethylaminohydrolase